MENLSDQNLLLRIKRNDHDAFTILFGRYWKSMFRSARSRLNDSEIAQDLVQEIFIRIWQRRSTLQITGPLENYLMGSVRLSVINHFKSSKASDNQLESALQRINILEDSIESLTDYLELEKTLEQAVELMPEMLKRVYEMRSENLSVKAIAGELGIADQTVRNYISEVSRRLRIVISQKFPEKHLTYILLIAAMLNK
jgi:RNA polymerase sigma factor (sigma-70 family)